MPISAMIISIFAVSSAVLAIWSGAKARRPLFRVSKPLTTALIILVALIAPAPMPAAYKTFILAGLLCSLAGDVALIVPEKWFAAGLGSFLAAHVFYILAFKPGPGHKLSAGLVLPFLIFGMLMFRILVPSLGRLRLPVFVYIVAITAMAWLAAGRFVDLGGTRPLLAFAGAVLFLVSDSVLAYDRFVKKFGLAQAVVLGTYFPAQLLIALSI